MKFASTLKGLREKKHITQKDLADVLGVTRSAIAGYETKDKQPDFERLLRIASYFRVTVDYLLTGSVESISTNTPFKKEQELLYTYSKLSSESQQQLADYIYLLELKEESERKKRKKEKNR